MDKNNQELNQIQNNNSQMNPLENQNNIPSNNLETNQIPTSTISNLPVNPADINIQENPELSPQPQIDNLLPNNINNNNNNNNNLQRPELNIQQMVDQPPGKLQNHPQIGNLNQLNLPGMPQLNPQINEQYIQHFQNQLPPISNNPDIPMKGYMLNYPQMPGQISPEQADYQQNDYHENKNIYDYATNMKLFGIAFQNRNSPRLAISSLEKRLDNKIEILELIENDLKKVYEMQIGYPCTKLLWSPKKSEYSQLAFSSDCIEIYDYSEEKKALIYKAKLNNIKSKYNGPLTSFDWNTANESLLGTASVDTTCTIWDLNKQSIKTQLIAHDKEVFDIQFGKEENIFISGGADGSVRFFDLRNLDHSTIIYETKESSAINKLAWNLQAPNLIAALSLDKNVIYIFDSRMNSNVSLDELKLHSEPVTGCVWAPDTPTQLCSVSEDGSVIISNVDNEQSQNTNVSYNANFPINNVDWCKSFPEWIGITFKERVQLLRK